MARSAGPQSTEAEMACAAVLDRLAEAGSTVVFSRLLEVELWEVVFNLAIYELWTHTASKLDCGTRASGDANEPTGMLSLEVHRQLSQLHARSQLALRFRVGWLPPSVRPLMDDSRALIELLRMRLHTGKADLAHE